MKSLILYLTEAQKEEKALKVGYLDEFLNGQTGKENQKEKAILFRSTGPSIYAFTLDKLKDTIKIGYTDQNPQKRIDQWKKIYAKSKAEVTCIGVWSAEEVSAAGEKVFFWDFPVHEKVIRKGFDRVSEEEFMMEFEKSPDGLIDVHYSKEFFRKYSRELQGNATPKERVELSVELITDILNEMKENIKKGTNDFKVLKFKEDGQTEEATQKWPAPKTYSNTELQEEAITNGINAIKKGKTNLLMAAVMRFGKTHASYEIVKRMKMKRVIVTTGKTDTLSSWRDDINHVDFYKDFAFVEFVDSYNYKITVYDNYLKSLVTKKVYINTLEGYSIFEELKDKTIIVFASLQDLSGSINQLKSKHKDLFGREFDMMIIDETHYGSHSNTFGNITELDYGMFDAEDSEDRKNIEDAKKDLKAIENATNKISHKVKLQVSGTPYYILASNEMLKGDAEIISKVSYTDMVEARDKWEVDHPEIPREESPYYGIPNLEKIGLRLTQNCIKAIKNSDYTESMTTLFKVENGKFKYEKAIKELMTALFGDGSKDRMPFLEQKSVSGSKICKHTIIVLPRIDSCEAMKNLLQKLLKTSEREILLAVGSREDVKNVDELNKKLYDIERRNKKSITLTVNKYLTGVSMPLMDSMIYLKNNHSPQAYDQSIFRLTTRDVREVTDYDGEGPRYVNMKDTVYVIDFNTENMIDMTIDTAKRKALVEGDYSIENIEKKLKQELDAMPIYSDSYGEEIFDKMSTITSKDLLNIFSKYNVNKTIEQIVDDESMSFSTLFSDTNFRNAIDKINIKGSKTSKTKIKDSENEIDLSLKGYIAKNTSKSSSQIEKERKNEEKKLKEKLKAIMKIILYINVCLEPPYVDLESFIKGYDNNSAVRKVLSSYDISKDDLELLYDSMSGSYKQYFNRIVYKISMLAEDLSKNDHEKFVNSISGLGRLGKSEVITPKSLVDKMIDKLPKSAYSSAKSILLVNEKSGEFLDGLIRKFGEGIAKKCKIASSSEIGKMLIQKYLKSRKLDSYIDNIVLDIEDYNGNGNYDINDFLDMSNSDILKQNSGKKFDICLMNPPYDKSSNGDQLYVKFLNKSIEVSNLLIAITPEHAFISKASNNKLFKQNINLYKPELVIGDWKEFDVNPNSRSCISIWNILKPSKKIKVGNKEFDKQDEIVLNDNPYIDLFYEKLKKYFKTNKSIYDECVANPKNKQYFDPNGRNKIQETWENPNTWFTVFPYCIAAHFTTFEYKKYSDELWNGPARILVPFDTEKYAKNCYLTIQKENGKRGDLTNFFKLISNTLVEKGYIQSQDKYKYFPYLDFSKSYSDEDLFKLIGMKYDKKEVDKILNYNK